MGGKHRLIKNNITQRFRGFGKDMGKTFISRVLAKKNVRVQ